MQYIISLYQGIYLKSLSNLFFPFSEIKYCTSNPCDPNAVCAEGYLKADCMCKSGYYGDGKLCSDVDECRDVKLNDCHQSADCKNHKGGHTCTCKPGFKGNGKKNCESK